MLLPSAMVGLTYMTAHTYMIKSLLVAFSATDMMSQHIYHHGKPEPGDFWMEQGGGLSALERTGSSGWPQAARTSHRPWLSSETWASEGQREEERGPSWAL